MSQITVDLTGAEDAFEPIPSGVYVVVVTNVTVKESRTSEWKYINLELTVIEGKYADRKLWVNLSLSPKALWKMKEALIAFGTNPDELQGQYTFDPAQFVGGSCIAEVIQAPNPQTGVLRNEVKALHPQRGRISQIGKKSPKVTKKENPPKTSGPLNIR